MMFLVFGLSLAQRQNSKPEIVNQKQTRRGDRVAEGARLESVCALTGYRGFESLPLRIHFHKIPGRVACGRPAFLYKSQCL